MADDRLEKLRARQAELAARIRREENRKRLQERKDDTRRKILAGAAVLDEAEHKSEFNTVIVELLGRFLTRPDDRALFALPPLPPEKPELVHSETSLQTPTNAVSSSSGQAEERMAG
jgi:hypothetical protein